MAEDVTNPWKFNSVERVNQSLKSIIDIALFKSEKPDYYLLNNFKNFHSG